VGRSGSAGLLEVHPFPKTRSKTQVLGFLGRLEPSAKMLSNDKGEIAPCFHFGVEGCGRVAVTVLLWGFR
jgi:hypothetical protein